MCMESKVNIKTDIKVEAPCLLVYIAKSGEVKIMQVLDFALRENLWGMKCGNIFVALKNSGFNDWVQAMQNAPSVPPASGWKITLAPVDSLSECFVANAQFQKGLEFLHVHAVEAEDWLKGWYWSGEQFEREAGQIHTFDMKNGRFGTHDFQDSNGFVRYALLKLPE